MNIFRLVHYENNIDVVFDYRRYILLVFDNKCSAVAEMGDHLAAIDIGQKVGGCWIPI